MKIRESDMLPRHVKMGIEKCVFVFLICLCGVALCSSAVAFFSESGLVVSAASSNANISALEDEVASLQNRISEIEKQKSDTDAEVSSALAEKVLLDEQVMNLEQKISKSEELAQMYNDKLWSKNVEISEHEAEVDKKFDEFRGWLKMMYEYGDISYIGIILEADSFTEFLESTERLGNMIEYQTSLMDELNQSISVLASERDELSSLQQKELDNLSILDNDKSRLDILVEQSEVFLEELLQTQKQQQEYLDEAQKMSVDLDAQIAAELQRIAEEEERAEQARLEAERAAQLERERIERERLQREEQERLQQEYEDALERGEVVDPPQAPDPTIEVSSVGLRWPLDANYNTISSGYGWRDLYGVADFHMGIDLPAPRSTNIYASASGKVLKAEFHSSYGNYVLIDHGTGYSTLYAHCTALFVSVGQYVNQGDVIASVGSTGNAYGSHLHFEVRVNGEHRNPVNYVIQP